MKKLIKYLTIFILAISFLLIAKITWASSIYFEITSHTPKKLFAVWHKDGGADLRYTLLGAPDSGRYVVDCRADDQSACMDLKKQPIWKNTIIVSTPDGDWKLFKEVSDAGGRKEIDIPDSPHQLK